MALPRASRPIEATVELTPRARFDVIDVREHVQAVQPHVLDFPKAVYCSFHTTAGYLEQSLASRLHRGAAVEPYVRLFRHLFPEAAGYRHDELTERTELTTAQKEREPLNGDSHLAFIASGLHPCVTYRNKPAEPVYFIDLDGTSGTTARQRRSTVIGFNSEVEVARVRLSVPVSGHPVDSINLKDPRLGIYERVSELLARHDVQHGRIRLELAGGERHAGLTVNEYETLLMRHDLADVLRNPLRFVVEKSRNALADPHTVPAKALDYAKYDLVRAFNELIDALGLNESMFERVLSHAIAMPAARFLRMKRAVSLLVSDADQPGCGRIVEGTYQSPILVQWSGASTRVRHVNAIITRFR